jgi:hypothetical protein
MDNYTVFPDRPIIPSGVISEQFYQRGINTFHKACRFVHELPYGYNSDRNDLMILFKENMGSCTTKHAVIATLAEELNLPVVKNIGIYAMTEQIVTGTDRILDKHTLPYLPMVHCFLACDRYRVDLTEGNNNGKSRPIDDFLYTETVIANISAKDEYLKYRMALKALIAHREELRGKEMTTILHAREAGLALLKAKVSPPAGT